MPSFVLVLHRMLFAIFTDWVKMIRGNSRNVAERWPIYSKHHSDAVNTIGREILSYPPPSLIHSSLSPVYLSPNSNISQLDRNYWVNIEKENSLSNQVLSVRKIPCFDTVRLTGKKVLCLRGNLAEHHHYSYNHLSFRKNMTQERFVTLLQSKIDKDVDCVGGGLWEGEGGRCLKTETSFFC